MITKKDGELGKALRLQWKITPDELNKLDHKFVKGISDILWHFHMADEEGLENTFSVYNYPMILHTLDELMENYKHLFHILYTTLEWENNVEEEGK